MAVHPAFRLIRTDEIPSLNVSLEEYQHVKTQARHFHIVSEDNNNAFLVAFLTVPQDSTGVAHILEHTTLCGSRRYPVRDPFFMMLRRSLNTFMNAFTSSDWTAYPFASQNEKDFNNLLQVYLDAVFFPNLNPLDFAQEGHRVEFEDPDNTDSPLVYKGVVFNEMKGAMSSPVSTLWQVLSGHLYPTQTYHYNSGGEPEDIPNLTWQQLKDFHALHYHPSNSVFMTYGNLPAAEHQAVFEECALQHFSYLDTSHLQIADEQRYSYPLREEAVYALDGEEDTSKKTHIVLSWLLGQSSDMRERANAYLLSEVLLDNSASPLQHALETCGLGTSPSPLCGLESDMREMVFACGLEGSEPEQADAVEALILSVLEKVAEEGIPQEHIEAVLHQFELGQREITGDRMPYGLRLMLGGMSAVLHGGDPLAVLNIDPILEALREDIQDPEFIKSLVRQLLLNNQHRVRLVMRPDVALSAKKAQAEKARLLALKESLSEADKQKIIEQTHALNERQQQEDDPDLLPKVTLEDVSEDFTLPEGDTDSLADMPTTWYSRGTNGMVYEQVLVELPELEPELLEVFPLFCECLTEVGVADQDYLQIQQQMSAVSGGIGAHCSMRSQVDDVQKLNAYFVLSGRALLRNQAPLAELMQGIFSEARFDETQRLRELISQERMDAESSITGRGSSLAMNAVSAGMNALGQLRLHWDGLLGIRAIKALDNSLNEAGQLEELAARFQRIQAKLLTAPRQSLLIGEEQQRELIAQGFVDSWQYAPAVSAGSRFQPSMTPTQIKQAWSVNTQVNFCAKAYPVVAAQHADAPALMVLGEFLRNGYLHRAIREKGGAYGGGAGYDPETGSFRFYSYRDPRLTETLADFDHAVDWLQTHQHEARSLEEAVLSIIGRIDRPGSPAGEARGAFYGQLHGRTLEHRRAFRSAILQVSIEDLQRVGQTYLQTEKASIAVISNANTLNQHAENLGLSVEKL